MAKSIEYPKFEGGDVPFTSAEKPTAPPPYTGPLPRALNYTVIIRPKPPVKNFGLIALADRTKRANLATETVGQILALGANTFKLESGGVNMKDEPGWPKIGDWVIYRQNAGQRLRMTSELDRVKAEGGSASDEVHLLIMTDSDVLCTIPEAEVYDYYSWV